MARRRKSSARLRKNQRIRRGRIPAEPSGEVDEMYAIGQALSGTQPDIGHKDTGVGRRVREGARRRPSERR